MSPAPSKRTNALPHKDVWEKLQRRTEKYRTVDLGMGQSDGLPPQFALDAILQAAGEPTAHQYPRDAGLPRLTKAISSVYSPEFSRELDPSADILVTSGAYAALNAACLSFISEGDEVIIFRPFFPAFPSLVELAGGKCVYVDLLPNNSSGHETGWYFDPTALNQRVTARTRAILLNTPHNPTGKVFTREELMVIRDLCVAHDLLCISDEVYEWMILNPAEGEVVQDVEMKGKGPMAADDEVVKRLPVGSPSEDGSQSMVRSNNTALPEGEPACENSGEVISRNLTAQTGEENYESAVSVRKHTRIATLPDMWERALTICSAGKVFGATGWRLGWIIGSSRLVKWTTITYCSSMVSSSRPIQIAVAQCLEKCAEEREKAVSWPNQMSEPNPGGPPTHYLASQGALLKRQYEALWRGFRGAGFYPVHTEGSYFMLVNWTTCRKTRDIIHRLRSRECTPVTTTTAEAVKTLGGAAAVSDSSDLPDGGNTAGASNESNREITRSLDESESKRDFSVSDCMGELGVISEDEYDAVIEFLFSSGLSVVGLEPFFTDCTELELQNARRYFRVCFFRSADSIQAALDMMKLMK